MRIKTKSKSPTVIVIEQGTMDEKKNDLTARRMDSFERKLDAQFKVFTDKTDYVKLIEKMQKSFMVGLDKMVSTNKSIISDVNNKKINALRSDFKTAINTFKSKGNDEAILKSFASKLDTLNRSVKNISAAPQQQVKVVNRGTSLNKSFDTLFLRMQELIRKSGPRMIPSPS